MNVHFGHPKICASHQEGNEIKSSYLMAYLCHIFLICKVGKIMLLIASIMTEWDHMIKETIFKDLHILQYDINPVVQIFKGYG